MSRRSGLLPLALLALLAAAPPPALARGPEAAPRPALRLGEGLVERLREALACLLAPLGAGMDPDGISRTDLGPGMDPDGVAAPGAQDGQVQGCS